ncbi:hypothetical protein BGZ76_007929, partial [Entomortierella beljakovae]
CIRNGFALVPVMPQAYKEELRKLGTESPDEEIQKIRQEISEKWKEMADVMSRQTNTAVLNYLRMCNAEGPSLSINEFINKVVNNSRFEAHFLKPHERVDIEEDEIEDDEDLDLDYLAQGIRTSRAVRFNLCSRNISSLQEY